MTASPLAGLPILIVEDQPLVAMDTALAFEPTGARITTTNTLQHALLIVEHDDLAAAVLDHALERDTSEVLYERLWERDIPFMIYSGLTAADGLPADVPIVIKPAPPGVLVSTLEDLVRRHNRGL